ncbi:MAG TPA: GNAT family N-acetyltransferase [Actinomycetes bacterium]|nr:GNAT family N-acetyltransferase [Actinomycetes bacterium]
MNGDDVEVRDDSGELVLGYLPLAAGGGPFADFVTAGSLGPDAAADAAARELSGWRAATTDPQLVAALRERGAVLTRHAHIHSRDLIADPAPAAWAVPLLPFGLRITGWDRPLEEVAVVVQAAYPPGHPDHHPRTSLDEVAAKDLRPYVLEEVLGPMLPVGGLVVDQERVVALLAVTDRQGVAPDGGPWVVDVARLPDPAYAGAGAALLQRALALLTEAGAPSLSLAVSEGNPARRLYERLGLVHAYSAWTLAIP